MNNFGYNTVFLSEWKIMHFILVTFRDNLFADSQLVILHNSTFNKCSSAGFPLISQNSVISSAYIRIIFNILVHIGQSLMYTEKRKGPKPEPFGTPVLISSVSDVEPLKSTT